jgi:Tetratricopeptide repeat
MRLEIKPQGIDLGVNLQLPDGQTQQLFQPFEHRTDLVIGEVAEKSGVYLLDVYTIPNVPAGHYEIRLAELRAATEKERALQEARKLFYDAFRLHRQGRNNQAIPLMTKSLEVRERELGPDDLLVGITGAALGSIYDDLGDYATARRSFCAI